MSFTYARTIRFADTDAAGVVFFPNYFSICHEAYEEALAVAGIELAAFFRAENVLVPIARTEAEYLRPLHAGEKVTVSVAPQLLSPDSFAIRFELHRTAPVAKLVARVRTEHVATSTAKRERVPLPEALRRWIDASATP